ncbi:hypothetical protein FRC06_011109 [Ceratobasidium sp. 370]|nr:hypothetical protein FRC06_011109 [Ceratobasidium sp. 370]
MSVHQPKAACHGARRCPIPVRPVFERPPTFTTLALPPRAARHGARRCPIPVSGSSTRHGASSYPTPVAPASQRSWTCVIRSKLPTSADLDQLPPPLTPLTPIYPELPAMEREVAPAVSAFLDVCRPQPAVDLHRLRPASTALAPIYPELPAMEREGAPFVSPVLKPPFRSIPDARAASPFLDARRPQQAAVLRGGPVSTRLPQASFGLLPAVEHEGTPFLPGGPSTCHDGLRAPLLSRRLSRRSWIGHLRFSMANSSYSPTAPNS